MQKNGSTAELAAETAQRWKEGLAEWGEEDKRIQCFCQAAERVVYIPGSNAGIPISILGWQMFPPKPVHQDQELLQDRVASTVNSRLSLADPLQSSPHPHIFLGNLYSHAWQQGRDLDLGLLIQAIQPP